LKSYVWRDKQARVGLNESAKEKLNTGSTFGLFSKNDILKILLKKY
jgi:hypothetical protein